MDEERKLEMEEKAKRILEQVSFAYANGFLEVIAEGYPDVFCEAWEEVEKKLDQELMGLAELGKKIKAIKLVRKVKGLGVREAREYVEKKYVF